MTATTIVTEKNQKTIAEYLGDMQAVETHIEEALDHQLDLFADERVQKRRPRIP